MVVVEFEYEEMRKLIDLPKDRMVASLSDLGAPSEYEPEVKKIITELTPNRPDWYSMEGLARALRSYHGGKPPHYSARKSDYTVVVDKSVASIRPYTVCAVVDGLRFDDQRIRDIILLQEKLIGTLGRRAKKFGIGIYPLHTIEFPIRYTTMKREEVKYVPLGFTEEMGVDDILEKHKKGKEYGHLIKDQKRFGVFIDAKDRVMSLIPIVNSAETGKVDESTKGVFVEVTGESLHACKAALNIIVCTFADMGGIPYAVLMDYGAEKFLSPDLEPAEVKIDRAEISKVLGIELSEKDLAAHLARMGYAYAKGAAKVPPYRADVLGPIDVIEDVAISYGYNSFRPTLPNFFCAGEALRTHDSLDETMRGMGFMETKTFMLTNKDKLGVSGHDVAATEITNPGSVDYTVVRPSLLVDMLETITINKMKALPQKFYEMGVVQDGDRSAKRLVFGVVDKKTEFAEVRGYLQMLAAEQGFGFVLEKTKNKFFDGDTSCAVVIGGKRKGAFGKVNKAILERAGIGFDAYICELEL